MLADQSKQQEGEAFGMDKKYGSTGGSACHSI